MRVLAAVCLALAGCGGDMAASHPAGSEGGACKPGGTCLGDLVCVDDTCMAVVLPDAAQLPDARPMPDAAPVPDSRPPDAGVDARPLPDAGPPPPDFVRITIISAVVAPSQASRSVWDGVTSISSSDWATYTTALAKPDPYQAVLAALASVGPTGTARPDPYGGADLFVDDGMEATVDLAASGDTYTPSFAGGPTFRHVRWTGNVRVFIRLFDEDVVLDDTIGYANLEQAELQAALAAGTARHILVANQTANQLAFVTVTVTPD